MQSDVSVIVIVVVVNTVSRLKVSRISATRDNRFHQECLGLEVESVNTNTKKDYGVIRDK